LAVTQPREARDVADLGPGTRDESVDDKDGHRRPSGREHQSLATRTPEEDQPLGVMLRFNLNGSEPDFGRLVHTQRDASIAFGATLH